MKNPVGFDPTRFKDRALARRNVVLNRMGELDVIDRATAQKLTRLPLGLKVSKSRNGCVSTKAPFFCDYARRYLMSDPVAGQDRRQPGPAAQQRRPHHQDHHRPAPTSAPRTRPTDAAVNEQDQAIGALAMVQPGTGEVLAISQSRPMGRDKKKGQTFLNYVVDSKYGDSNGFQAGSTFKVFVLAAALEQGLPTSTRFKSPERMSIPQNDFATCDGPYPVYAPWNLGNSTGAGNFDMVTGTRKSVNTYYAQLEKKTGLCEPYALAKAMGVDLTDPDHERVPSFVLGVAGVSPLEMAAAYATFAARGKSCENRPVTQILNSDGKVFKNYPKRCQQVMLESTADTVNDILEGVLAPGGFGQALALSQPAAGKTGTINEQHGGVVQRLHAQPVHRRDDRGGQLTRVSRSP